MSRKVTRRKCHCCNIFFHPDHRNAGRQKFCSAPACRQASKAASQRRWSRKTENHDYFRGERNVERVQEWRRKHPGYWRKQKPRSQRAQAADSQPVNSDQLSCNASCNQARTLQDSCLLKVPEFVGLISLITGSTLQDDIAATGRRLILQGQNILGLNLPGIEPSTSTPAHP